MKDIHEEYKLSCIPQEVIDELEQRNPYRKYGWFFGKFELIEHKNYNDLFASGYMTGRHTTLIRLISELKGKMPKEELRQLLNRLYGGEVLKNKEDDNRQL